MSIGFQSVSLNVTLMLGDVSLQGSWDGGELIWHQHMPNTYSNGNTKKIFARSWCSKEQCPLAFLALFFFLHQFFFCQSCLLHSWHTASEVLSIYLFGCPWVIFIDVCHGLLRIANGRSLFSQNIDERSRIYRLWLLNMILKKILYRLHKHPYWNL